MSVPPTDTGAPERATTWPFRLEATVVSVPARQATVALYLLGALTFTTIVISFLAGGVLCELVRLRETIIAK